MKFLLDTNVISEPTRASPDLGVLTWLEETDEDRLYLSAMTLAELHRGVARLPEGTRRTRLQRWLDDEVTDRFRGRITPVDAAIAVKWGRLMAQTEAAGKQMGTIDGFLAATALAHDFMLVTRNVADFSGLGIRPFSPWVAR